MITKVVEFEVRTLNIDGDVEDVWHFETCKAAITNAKRQIADGAIAVVVERHTSRRPAELAVEADKYVIVYTDGNPCALTSGGWTNE
jgi:hypothetical protein